MKSHNPRHRPIYMNCILGKLSRKSAIMASDFRNFAGATLLKLFSVVDIVLVYSGQFGNTFSKEHHRKAGTVAFYLKKI